MVTYPVIEPAAHPHFSVERLLDIGDLGGASEPAINTTKIAYVLDAAIIGWTIDYLRIWHDGMTAAAGNRIDFNLYILDSDDKLIDANFVSGNQCAAEYQLSTTSAGYFDMVFTAYTEAQRKIGAGQKLVLVIDSIGDGTGSGGYASTAIDSVVAKALGRTWAA